MKTKLVNVSLLKQPSAYLPLTMSLAALTLVLGHAAVYGVVHEVDEGTAAHVWQILMAAQLPIVAYFLLKWLPRRPKESLQVLALLAGTWLQLCRSLLAHLAFDFVWSLFRFSPTLYLTILVIKSKGIAACLSKNFGFDPVNIGLSAFVANP